MIRPKLFGNAEEMVIKKNQFGVSPHPAQSKIYFEISEPGETNGLENQRTKK